jgi:SPX domain protein involved in polyphosphate accumulation
MLSNILVEKTIMFKGKTKRQTSGQDTGSHQLKSDEKNKKKQKSNPADRTLSCRHELKYQISESKAIAIAQYIKPYLQADRYSKLQRGGDYPIVSLYLDSVDMRLCRESLTGQKNRFKLRIRSYTDEPEYPRFFEIKRRINTIIFKSRARVMDRDVRSLLEGLPLPPQDYTADEETINQFQLYLSSIRAKPAVLIRYKRQAYEGEHQNRVRVTFDRELAYNVTRLPEVRLGGSGWQRNPYTDGSVILEIKFTDHYPAWLAEMVKYFNLRQQSISKYASSIQESCSVRFCAPQLTV